MNITPNTWVKVKPEHCNPGLSPDKALRVTALHGDMVKIEYPYPSIKGERQARFMPSERLINIKAVVICEL